jgi:hypothetical protein
VATETAVADFMVPEARLHAKPPRLHPTKTAPPRSSFLKLSNASRSSIGWLPNRAKENIMILSALTPVHVILSLVGIGSGFVVASGLLASKSFNGWTSLFLTTTAATCMTGFFFPFHGFSPAYGVGIVSLIVLVIASWALYRYRLVGGWRRTYAITVVFALYLNVSVLIVQLFRKVPALNAIAPTQSEPPFQITQLAALVLFVGLAIRAAKKDLQRGIPHG